MTTRSRLQNNNDSKSLWNFTLSPGWSGFDAHILRLAIVKYGCGAWRDISRHFPLKNCNQLNLQTQRLFGQQALAEFNKVHIDPSHIGIINAEIEGFRKNQCLINTGNNLSLKKREERRIKHTNDHGVPKELYEAIQLPIVLDPPAEVNTVIDEIEKLREMYRCIYDIELRLRHLKSNNGKNAANIKVNARKNKNKNKNESEQKNETESNDIVMNGNNNSNKSNNNEKQAKAPQEVLSNEQPMDEDVQMAMALSMSMSAANINTPAAEKKKKSKKGKKKSTKKSSKKKKKSTRSKKRKKMDKDDDEYTPNKPAKKRVKK